MLVVLWRERDGEGKMIMMVLMFVILVSSDMDYP